MPGHGAGAAGNSLVKVNMPCWSPLHFSVWKSKRLGPLPPAIFIAVGVCFMVSIIHISADYANPLALCVTSVIQQGGYLLRCEPHW